MHRAPREINANEVCVGLLKPILKPYTFYMGGLRTQEFWYGGSGGWKGVLKPIPSGY